MKLTRRGVLSQFAAVVAAVAVAPAIEAEAAENLNRPWHELTPNQRLHAWQMEEQERNEHRQFGRLRYTRESSDPDRHAVPYDWPDRQEQYQLFLRGFSQGLTPQVRG